MKIVFINLLLIFTKPVALVSILTYLIFSCHSPKKNSKDDYLGSSELDKIAAKAWNESGDLVQKITLGSKKIIRNQTWGVSLDSLNEKLELSENQPSNGKSFTLYFDNSDLNFTDISYISDKNNKLTEINFDIFVEKKSQVDELKEKLSTFLSVKFGAFKTIEKKNIWEKDKNTRVSLEDVSTPKDLGIRLVFSKII